MLRNYPYYQHANRLYDEAPEEVRDSNMPAAVGVLPPTLRVGSPIATYKLKKSKARTQIQIMSFYTWKNIVILIPSGTPSGWNWVYTVRCSER